MSELEQLRREMKWWQREAESNAVQLRQVVDENAALARENERLRGLAIRLMGAVDLATLHLPWHHPATTGLKLASEDAHLILDPDPSLEAHHDRD